MEQVIIKEKKKKHVQKYVRSSRWQRTWEL